MPPLPTRKSVSDENNEMLNHLQIMKTQIHLEAV